MGLSKMRGNGLNNRECKRRPAARVDDADVILYDIAVSKSEAAQQNQITEAHPERCLA